MEDDNLSACPTRVASLRSIAAPPTGGNANLRLDTRRAKLKELQARPTLDSIGVGEPSVTEMVYSVVDVPLFTQIRTSMRSPPTRTPETSPTGPPPPPLPPTPDELEDVDCAESHPVLTAQPAPPMAPLMPSAALFRRPVPRSMSFEHPKPMRRRALKRPPCRGAAVPRVEKPPAQAALPMALLLSSA